MAYYNYKELRDSLPPEMVDKWAKEDGSADYNSTLWCYAADYIDQLTKERDGARRERDNFKKERNAKIDKIIAMQKFIDHTQDRWDWHKNELKEEQRKLREDLMRAAADCALENMRLKRERDQWRECAEDFAETFAGSRPAQWARDEAYAKFEALKKAGVEAALAKFERLKEASK